MKHRSLIAAFFLIQAPALYTLNQDSITLDESIRMALEQNSGIIFENLSRQDAWIRHRLTLRDFLPFLTMGYSETDSVTEEAPDGRIRKLNLTMNQLLFSGGREMARYRSSERELRLRDLKAQDLIDSVAHEVLLQFVEVLKYREILAIQERYLVNLREQIKIAALELDLGLLRETDFLEIRINASEFSLNIRDTEEQFFRCRDALAVLMNIPSDRLPPLKGRLNTEYRGEYSRETLNHEEFIPGMKRRAEEYNKDLISLSLQEINAGRARTDSRISWLPKIEATADFSVSAADFPLDEPSFSLGLNFSFTTPLLPGSLSLQAGKSNPREHNRSFRSEVGLAENLEGLVDPFTAESNLIRTRMNREELRRSLVTRVGSLTRAIDTGLLRVETGRERIDLETEKLALDAERVKIGEMTRLDYVKSEIGLANFKTDLIENIAALYGSEKELEMICGIASDWKGGSLLCQPEEE